MNINYYLIYSILTLLASDVFCADISGKVEYAESTIGRSGVCVKLYSGERLARLESGGIGALSSGTGHFLFGGLEPGVYYVRVSRAGFEIGGPFAGRAVPSDVIRVELKDKTDRQDVNFKMPLGANVTGRVLLDNGKPPIRASVGIEGNQLSVAANADGIFTIVGIPTGDPVRITIVIPGDEKFDYIRFIDMPVEKLRPAETTDIGIFSFSPLPEIANVIGVIDRPGINTQPWSGACWVEEKKHSILSLIRVSEGKFTSRLLPGEYEVKNYIDLRRIGKIAVPKAGTVEVKLEDVSPATQPSTLQDRTE